MAKLTDEEKKLLEDLTNKAKEEDPDENFEIEIYDTSKGRGARVPFKQGKSWLFENFGLGEDPNPKQEGDQTGDGKGGENVRAGYFGRSQQKKTGEKTG